MLTPVNTAWLTSKVFSQQIQPLLANIRTSAIRSRIGVSRWYAGRIRHGYVPDVSFVDRLDQLAEEPRKTTPQQNATQAQLLENGECDFPAQASDLIGGGGWTRTNDLRIMRTQERSDWL